MMSRLLLSRSSRFFSITRSASVAVASIVLSGCMGEALESTSPEDNSIDNPRYTDVTATFKVDMNASTIDTASFKLFDKGTNQYVGTTVGYDADSRTAWLEPNGPLSRATQYEATLVDTISTASGTKITESHTWHFETANSPIQGLLNTVAATDIVTRGDYAYYVARLRRFVIVDLSVPEKPSLASQLNIDGAGWGVQLKGNYALVSNGNIQTVDISNPQAPVIVNTLDVDYRRSDIDAYVGSEHITLDGNYLYASVQNFGLWVFDVADPTNPIKISEVDVFPSLGEDSYYGSSIVKQGNTVYVNREDGSTMIYDVSNPLAPAFIREYSDYPAKKWLINGDIAYAVNRNWLRVLDISDTENPVYVGEVSSDIANSAFQDITLDGQQLVVTDMIGSRLVKYDISNPIDPVFINIVSGINFASKVGSIDSETYYATSTVGGLFSIEK